MNFVEIVKQICKERRIPISKLEKDCGFSNGYIAQLRRGTMPFERMLKVAEYLDISLGDIEKDNYQGTQSKPQGIPVLGLVRAGIPLEEQENIMDYIPATMKHPEEYFALVVKGDSMQPRLFEGDIVIVHSQPDAENGELVVAKVNGDEACVKRLLKYSHSIALQSLNPAYPLMTFSEEQITSMPVTILGKVVKMEARFYGRINKARKYGRFSGFV